MSRSTLALLVAIALVWPALAQPPAGNKAKAKSSQPASPEKELTRQEIAKLGGFEPAVPDDDNAPINKGPANLNFDVLMVSMPEDLAVPLVETFRNPTKAEAACRQVMKLVQARKAKVTAWPRVQTMSGNRVRAENIEEIRYAIEFEQSMWVATAKAAVAAAATKPAMAPAKVPAGPPLPSVVGAFPSTFEIRNAGATLELEPNISADEKTIEVSLSVQNVRLLGWDDTTVRENGTTKVIMPQPRFQTNKVTDIFHIRPGQRILLGTFQLPGAKGQMELFILGASISYPAMKGKEKAR